MHPTSRTCIQWAVGLFVAGALLMVFVPRIVIGLAEVAGINAALGVDLVDLVLTVARWTAFPLGAALIGAAVVIETLKPTSSPEGVSGNGVD